MRSKADGAAALARVGAANEGAGFEMNHDGVGAAEGFRSAGDNLMASALQFCNCRFGNTPLQANLDTFYVIEALGPNRFLDCHAEVDQVCNDLHVNLRLDVPAFEPGWIQRAVLAKTLKFFRHSSLSGTDPKISHEN
jgi:hypothetical protein